MSAPEEGGSLYDQFSGNQAPEQPKRLVREVGWQSAEKVNERYRDSLPDHVKESMTVTQADHSYYAFTRFAFGHPVRDNFEQQVNKQFGVLEKDFNFKQKREQYILLYREIMNQ
jgi:hypothetical protein